jgi:hypothetical protein
MTVRTISFSGSIAGVTFRGSHARDVVGETNGQPTTLAAGSAGVLSTRTDDNTGEVTLTAGHGQTSGTYDVFWDGGCRRGMTGTVTVNALALDGGAGDNLPVATSAVVVDKQETIDFDSESSTLMLVAVAQTRRASVQFQQEDGTPILSLDLGRNSASLTGASAEGFVWASDTAVTNPFGADIGKVVVSNGSSAGTNTITVGAGRSTV